jgi:intracellular septation protein A
VGLNTVLSLVLSGVLPAVGVAITAIQYRKLDIFGVMVLAGIVMGSILGLTTHDARLYLAEGSVPSAIFAVACLASLRSREPLIYRIALEFLGPDTRRGRDMISAWPSPIFKRAFRNITLAWGIGYLIEAALRMVVAETTSTGVALICSKVAPYVFAAVLAAWTLVYGERRRKASTTVSYEKTDGGAPAATVTQSQP